MSKLSKIRKSELRGMALESMAEYWKRRCLLAEKINEVSPCDPDMTKQQIEAINKYNDFILFYGKTEGEK